MTRDRSALRGHRLLAALVLVASAALPMRGDAPLILLDPGVHNARISALAVVADGSVLISGGKDKRIKLWDVESGQHMGSLYGRMDRDTYGQIDQCIPSPDGGLLLTKGFFGNPWSHLYFDFRLYDLAAGRQLFSFYAFDPQNSAHAFTQDGRYLMTGDTTGVVSLYALDSLADLPDQVRIVCKDQENYDWVKDWDGENDHIRIVEPELEFASHSGRIQGLHHFPGSNVVAVIGPAVPGGTELTIALYSLDRRRILDTVQVANPEAFGFGAEAIVLLVRSEEGSASLQVLDQELRITSEEAVDPLREPIVYVSPAGRRIAVFGRGGTGWVRDLTDPGCRAVEIRLDDEISAACWIDEENLIFASASDYALLYYSLVQNRVVRRIGNISRPVWSVGLQDGVVQAGYSPYEYINSRFPVEREFSLESLICRDIPPGVWPGGALMTTRGDVRLDYTSVSGGGSVNVYRGEGLVSNASASAIFDNIWQYGLLPDGVIVMGGTAGIIGYSYAEGLSGPAGGEIPEAVSQCATSDAHTDTITSFCSDGVFLLSGSLDHTISLFHTDRIGEYVYGDLRQDSSGPGYSANVMEQIPKTATVYFTDEDDFLIWTPDDYFMGSRNLFSRIGWYVNDEEGREGAFYPFEQFQLKYNRPDIVLERLGVVDRRIVDACRTAYARRLEKAGLTDGDLSGDLHLPRVVLSCPQAGRRTSAREVRLQIEATDSRNPIESIQAYLNKVPLFPGSGRPPDGGPSRAVKTDISLRLAKGRNEIQVSCTNAAGVESLKETIFVRNENPAAEPELFLAAVGVSDYRGEDFDLTYAHKDCSDIERLFVNEAEAFTAVHSRLLLDREATRENILALKRFFESAGRDDYVVLFLSGHGLRDADGTYFFATQDIDFARPETRGLAFDELDSVFEAITSVNKLLFLDTCFSGDEEDFPVVTASGHSAAGQVVSRGFPAAKGLQVGADAGVDASGTGGASGSTGASGREHGTAAQYAILRSDLFSDLSYGTGATVVSSSSSLEFSYEGPAYQNGLFTYALLRGLEDRTCDADGDGAVRVSELIQWLDETVPKLSAGGQTPSLRRGRLAYDPIIF